MGKEKCKEWHVAGGSTGVRQTERGQSPEREGEGRLAPRRKWNREKYRAIKRSRGFDCQSVKLDPFVCFACNYGFV